MSPQPGQTSVIEVWWTRLNLTAVISREPLQREHESELLSTSATSTSGRNISTTASKYRRRN